jgi:hypothetical protein
MIQLCFGKTNFSLLATLSNNVISRFPSQKARQMVRAFGSARKSDEGDVGSPAGGFFSGAVQESNSRCTKDKMPMAGRLLRRSSRTDPAMTF